MPDTTMMRPPQRFPFEQKRRSEVQGLLIQKWDEIEATGTCFQPNGDIIALLRTAAVLMESRTSEYPITCSEMTFVGWDTENAHGEELLRYNRIRDAAFCILNRDDPDRHLETSVKNVGNLLQYVGDMLER